MIYYQLDIFLIIVTKIFLFMSGLDFHTYIWALQFNYLSYELFLEKKSCQTPKKEKKKVDFGVLRMKVVWKFSVRLQKLFLKSARFKNIHC